MTKPAVPPKVLPRPYPLKKVMSKTNLFLWGILVGTISTGILIFVGLFILLLIR